MSRNEIIEQCLRLSIKALEDINKVELSNQRPGGYYTESAAISYNALKEIKKLLKPINKELTDNE